MDFTTTCEMCRRQIRHKSTVEQYQRLLQTLQIEFPCPRCSTPIQVRMVAGGLSYSTLIPASRTAPSKPDREEFAPTSTRPIPDLAVPDRRVPDHATSQPPSGPGFSQPASYVHSVSVIEPVGKAEPSVPFEPLSEAAPRRTGGSPAQRFMKWYNAQPAATQWIVLSPLLLILVLLLMWEPGRKPAASARPAEPDSAVTDPAGDSAAKGHPETPAADAAAEATSPSTSASTNAPATDSPSAGATRE